MKNWRAMEETLQDYRDERAQASTTVQRAATDLRYLAAFGRVIVLAGLRIDLRRAAMVMVRRLALVVLGIAIGVGASESLRLRQKAPVGPRNLQEARLKIDQFRAWAEAHSKQAKPTNSTPNRPIAR